MSAPEQVLVVEDNIIVSRMMQSILEQAGYAVRSCVDGFEAIEHAASLRPDIVLCDLMLPTIDGFEVLTQLQRNPRLADLPFVFISSRSDAETIRTGMNLGADDFLTKPFEPAQLLQAVRTRLKRRRTLQLAGTETKFPGVNDPETGLPGESEFLRWLESNEPGSGFVLIQVQGTDRLLSATGGEGLSLILRELASRLARFGQGYRGSGAADFYLPLKENPERTVQSVIAELKPPFTSPLGPIRLLCSYGVVLDARSRGAKENVRAARIAAQEAQDRSGGNSFGVYRNGDPDRVREQLSIENDFPMAIAGGRLAVHYQPQFRLDSGAIFGLEALTRWKLPNGEILSPTAWLPVLEQTGLVSELTGWVLGTAIASLVATSFFDPGRMRLAINISGRDLDDPNFPVTLAGYLREPIFPASCLEVEITESVAMRDPERAAAILRVFADRGISVAIDDFGTGYSSLAYLKRLPVQTLKIDRTFIQDLPGDPAAAAIVRNILQLGATLGLDVLAEGIEKQAQWDFLREAGCSSGQGFVCCAAEPIEGIERRFLSGQPV